MIQKHVHPVFAGSFSTIPGLAVFREWRADKLSATLQVPCYGTRTTAATEAWVQECVALGRGAKYGLAQLGVTQGGCIEPR